MERVCVVWITTLLVSIPSLAAYAQDTSDVSSSKWISVDAGAGALSDFSYTISGDASLQLGHQVFVIQMLYTREFGVLFLPGGHLPKEEMLSIGLLCGRTYSFHFNRMLFPFFPLALFVKRETDFSVSGATGVSMLSTVIRGPLVQRVLGPESSDLYARGKSITFGIPLQLEIVQYLSPSVGYGHRFYCVFNGKRSVWGLVLGLNLRI